MAKKITKGKNKGFIKYKAYVPEDKRETTILLKKQNPYRSDESLKQSLKRKGIKVGEKTDVRKLAKKNDIRLTTDKFISFDKLNLNDLNLKKNTQIFMRYKNERGEEYTVSQLLFENNKEYLDEKNMALYGDTIMNNSGKRNKIITIYTRDILPVEQPKPLNDIKRKTTKKKKS